MVSRREVLRAFAAIGLPYPVSLSARQDLPRFEILGSGPTVVTFNREPSGYFTKLAERFRVVVIDGNSQPKSQAFIASYTADRVCADILAIADAAGAARFAWFGFSYGAVVGLQLAARTNRLTALALGGWPPLGGQYGETLAFSESEAAQGRVTEFLTFYRSLRDWPEREAVAKITCPRMIFVGDRDAFEAGTQRIRIAALITEHRSELERLGWNVKVIPGFGHELGGRPDVVVPLVADFLASAL